MPCRSIGKAGTQSLDVTSWQGLMATTSSSLVVKNFINAIFEHSKAKEADIKTEDEIGRVILWSLKALAAGKWHTHDHLGHEYPADSAEGRLAGQDLAGGYFCIVWLLKSDLDYACNHLHLRHYSAAMSCDLCPCTRHGPPAMWPSNFFSDSGWTSALYNVDEWKALYPALPHWIFELDNVNQHNLEPVELHIIWLGTAMWFLGSVLWMLVFRVLPNDAPSNATSVWEQVSQCYSEMGASSQYTNLSINSFCNPAQPGGHYPKLKVKGTEVKSLTYMMCTVLEQQHGQ